MQKSVAHRALKALIQKNSMYSPHNTILKPHPAPYRLVKNVTEKRKTKF